MNNGDPWPTPIASEAEHAGTAELAQKALTGIKQPNGRPYTKRLSEMVKLWPTPQANDGNRGTSAKEAEAALLGIKRPSGAHRCKMLGDMVKLFPTPTANDADNSKCPPSQVDRSSLAGYHLRNGGKPGEALNPNWVDLIMGWPQGWSSLEPLDTAELEVWRAGFTNGESDKYGAQPWLSGAWEAGTPRVKAGVPQRRQRIKALGNGQVPATAAKAWRLLMGDVS